MIPVVIVGLGRIGAGNVGLAGSTPLSHLAAVRAVPGLEIAGLVDPSEEARAHASSQWSGLPPGPLAGDLADLPVRTGEVIALCTPPSVRLAAIEQALARRPRFIIVEKPLALSLEEARKIAIVVERAQIDLRVNFNRRFDPRHCRWCAKAPAKPRAVIMRYSKGLMNYASHMIDLLLDWYGPIESVRAFSAPASPAADPNMSFKLRMAAGFDATAIGIDGLEYDQFEIDILGPHDRVELTAGGADIRRYKPVDGLHYKGYRQLAEVETERDVGPVGGFAELYAAIVAHLLDGAQLGGCDSRSALAGIATMDAVRRSSAAGGQAVSPEVLLAA